MAKSVWIVGQAPSQASDAAFPFRGRSGARLVELIGCHRCGGSGWKVAPPGRAAVRRPQPKDRPKPEKCACVERPDELLRERGFRLANLLDSWPGKAGAARKMKGDAFDNKAARAAALAKLRPLLEDGDRVIALGNGVLSAVLGMLYADVAPLRFCAAVGGAAAGHGVALLPHLSGVNLWWNDLENRAAARDFLRGLARCHHCAGSGVVMVGGCEPGCPGAERAPCPAGCPEAR